jgi:hypothetical protein
MTCTTIAYLKFRSQESKEHFFFRSFVLCSFKIYDPFIGTDFSGCFGRRSVGLEI